MKIHLATTPEEQKKWMAQWRSAEVALREIKIEELRAMSEAEAAANFNDLDMDFDLIHRSPERRDGSGLVEQQRLFKKLYASESGA